MSAETGDSILTTLFHSLFLALSAQFEHTLLVTSDGVEALAGKNENSMLQFWEKESEIYKGFFMGTSEAAKKRAQEINAAVL